ncbi:MAG: shikimate dehydrogenase [Dermatophilaceae bacterium]
MVRREQGDLLRTAPDPDAPGAIHRAAVFGSPVGHSLSPVLHRAAYRALDLRDWRYERVDVDEAAFRERVARLDATWRGLSLTMPLKEIAFEVADEVSALAHAVGSINTLVRRGDGWSADNTDVYGIAEALRLAGAARVRAAAVVGSGATSRSVLAALVSLGVTRVTFLVRGELRPATAAYSETLGLDVDAAPLGAWPDADVIVGTVPTSAYPAPLQPLPSPTGPAVVLDCAYGGGPSPLLAVARSSGYAAVPGTEMLLHQAGEQVRLMTGQPAPIDAMRAALDAALAERGAGGRPDPDRIGVSQNRVEGASG